MTKRYLTAATVAIVMSWAAAANAATISFVYQCTDAGAPAPGPFCPAPSDGNDNTALVNSILQGLNSPPAPAPVSQFARFNDGGPNTGHVSWFDVSGLGATAGQFDFLGDNVPGVTYSLTHFVVKGGNGFRVYSIDDGIGAFGVTSISDVDWSTLGLVNGGGRTPGLSHISFYGTSGEDVQVPEPASLLLLGAGLLGLAARLRRR